MEKYRAEVTLDLNYYARVLHKLERRFGREVSLTEGPDSMTCLHWEIEGDYQLLAGGSGPVDSLATFENTLGKMRQRLVDIMGANSEDLNIGVVYYVMDNSGWVEADRLGLGDSLEPSPKSYRSSVQRDATAPA